MASTTISEIRAVFAQASGATLLCRDIVQRLNANAVQSSAENDPFNAQTISGLLGWMCSQGELARATDKRPVGYAYNPAYVPKRPRANSGLKAAPMPPKPAPHMRETISRLARALQRCPSYVPLEMHADHTRQLRDHEPQIRRACISADISTFEANGGQIERLGNTWPRTAR